MKNKLIAVCLLCYCAAGWSQGGLTVNHVKGLKTFGIKYGGTKYSAFKYFAPEFNYWFNEKANLRINTSLDIGQIGETKYTDASIFAGAVVSPVNVNDKLYINAIIGGRVGVGFTSNSIFDARETHFIFGASGGLEVEYYFGRLSTSLEFVEHFTEGSPFGKWHWNTAVGLKYAL
jgi:hypothetical protein